MPLFGRRKLGSILILLTLLLGFACAAELGWRVLRPHVGRSVSVVFDPELGWKYEPNQKVRQRSQDFDVAVQIDGSGHRIAGPRSPGTSARKPLAVFVGDSLTFGWGVEAAEAFPFLLRHRLGVEVADLGVAGYGTDQSYLNLKRHGLPLRPTLVVYAFCGNDLREVSEGVRYGRPKPRFRQESGSLALSLPRDSASFLSRHSLLYPSLRAYLEGWLDPEAEGRNLGAQKLISLLIHRMARETQAAAARLVVVSDGTPWLAEATKAEPGAIYVELHEAFDRALRNGGVLSFPHDPHWTPMAHWIVAEKIAAAVGRVSTDQRASTWP
jgi:lysophospholipase L1-like esterase